MNREEVSFLFMVVIFLYIRMHASYRRTWLNQLKSKSRPTVLGLPRDTEGINPSIVRRKMDKIAIAGHLPTSVRSATHKSAVDMMQIVKAIAEANEGKLESFEISKPGTALLFVVGDAARQAIIREFKKLEGVVVEEVSALELQRVQNKKLQQRSDASKARLAKLKG